MYAKLLGAHILATARETWAVAPSLSNLRIIGLRLANDEGEVLFDVDAVRAKVSGPATRCLRTRSVA